MTITATLLLRESSTVSLTTIVEKSQQKRPPHPEYDLRLHQTQLELVCVSKPPPAVTPNLKSSSSPDEGFESDIDSLSIVSSDDSFTTTNNHHLENPVPKSETDSANGSACSDSDEIDSSTSSQKEPVISVNSNEIYDLVNCVCYSDVKFPDLLLFVIKEQVLVFKFDNLDVLNRFYSNFNALKAVTNQKTYGKTISNTSTKFNLLQRTDNNGITHIEISRQPNCNLLLNNSYEPSSIISISTPDFKKIHQDKSKSKTAPILENIIDNFSDNNLRKVWKSADDLLKEPRKPERRKRLKGKAPEPPTEQKDVLKGEYVRITVPKIDAEDKCLNSDDQKLNKAFNILGNVKPKLTTYQQFKYSEPKRIQDDFGGTLTRNRVNLENWTNSVPRLSKNDRSKSETRNFTPMAYRYIDTTLSNSPMYHRRYQPTAMLVTALPTVNNHISNRLFGMSGKLKDFGSNLQNRYEQVDVAKPAEGRWGSLNDLNHKIQGNEANLKSVIKKDENSKRKNEKKVTFSAYTTVQVV